MKDIITIYVVCAVLTACIGSFLAMSDDRDEGIRGARIALLCWAWPAIWAIGVARFVMELWDAAEWGASDE